MKTIILSPHCDDAIFSLSGSIINGYFHNIHVYNFFSKTNWTIQGSGEIESITKIRISEDKAAIKKIGAKSYYLGYTDASLRPGFSIENSYLEKEAYIDKNLFNNIKQVIEQIISKNNDANFLFPLGLGYHVDHQIISNIGKLFIGSNLKISFYEDIPYKINKDDYQVRKYIENFDNRLLPKINAIKSSQEKIDICSYYKTQVSPFLLNDIQAITQLRNGERIWN